MIILHVTVVLKVIDQRSHSPLVKMISQMLIGQEYSLRVVPVSKCSGSQPPKYDFLNEMQVLRHKKCTSQPMGQYSIVNS